MNRSNVSKVLMILGLFIPSVLYPFASAPGLVRDGNVTVSARLLDYEVVFREGEFVPGEGDIFSAILNSHYEGRWALSYKYAVALGIACVFLGIGLAVLTPGKGTPQSPGE